MMGLLLVLAGIADRLAVFILIRLFGSLIKTGAAEQAFEEGQLVRVGPAAAFHDASLIISLNGLRWARVPGGESLARSASSASWK
jgi:hypothetical protein